MRPIDSPINSFAILDHCPQGIFVLKKDWTILFWNHCLENWTGVSRDQILNHPINDLFPCFAAPPFISSIESVFADSSPVTFSATLPLYQPHQDPLKEGGSLFHLTANAFLDEQSHDLAALVVIQDFSAFLEECKEDGRLKSEASLPDRCQQARVKELHQLSDRLRLATASAHMGIWDWDIVNNHLEWDSKMFQLYGIEPHRFGRAYEVWTQGLHPEDRARTEREIQLALSEDKDFQTEFRVVWPDTSIHVIAARGLIQRNTQGQPIRMIGVNWDVTDQKQAEVALRESEERLNTALLATGGGAWEWDRPSGIMVFSPSWYENLDYAPNDLPSNFNYWKSLIHPDDQSNLAQALESFLAGKTGLFECENRFRTKQGFWKWNRTRGKVIKRGEDGTPTRLVGTDIDISKVKETQQQLHESQMFFSSVVENIPDMIFVKDAKDLRFHRLNKAGENLIGYPRETLIGKTDYDFFPKTEADFFTQKDREVLAGRTLVDIPEEIIHTHSQGPRYLHTKKIPLLDEKGNPQYLLGISQDITDRKHAETALRESEGRLQAILDHSSTVIYLKDLEGRYLFINRSFERIFHIDRNAVKGKTDLDLFPPDIAKTFMANDKKALESGPAFEQEEVAPHEDGLHTYISNKFPLLTADGVPYAVCGISTDITNRKKAELERAQREVLLNLIFETGPGCIKRVSADGILLQMNPAGLALIEAATEAEAIGLCVFDLVTPEHRRAFEDMHRDVIRGRTRTLQFEVLGMQGTRRWMETYAVPFNNPLTNQIEHLAVTHDITERKQDESRILQLHRQNELILASAGEGIYGLDLEGKTTFVNPAAAQMLGYTSEELIGSLMHDTVHHTWPNGNPYPRDLCPMYRALEDGKVHHIGHECLWRKDGTSFPVEYTTTPIRNECHEVVGAVVTFKDITDRKQAEDVISEAAHAVKQKNLELAKARDEALAAARSKTEFLTTMSHEIRTPLNGVSGMAELLLTTTITPEQRDMLNTITSCCTSLMGLINDILDSSKMEAGKLQLESLSFDLRALVQEVLDLVSGRAATKHLELVGLIHANVPLMLVGDPTRLRQILTNLLGNAIKFTETGEVSIHISTVSQQTNSVIIRIEVRDTGIGIESHACDALFEKFQQADSTMSRKYGGTGLGLTICKQLALLMKGDIGVESTPGMGSCFWVTLPFSCQTESTPPPSLPSLQGLRACIIADNATNLRVLTHYMQSWGIFCLTATSGKGGLEVLVESAQRGNPCDIAILDHSLPDLDPWTLGQSIQRHSVIPKTPLVLLTAMGKRGDAREAEIQGYAAYLSKPIHYHHLRQCLTLALGKKGQSKETIAQAPSAIITKHTVQELEHQSRIQILLAEDNLVNQKVTLRMLATFGLRADIVENGLEALRALKGKSYDLVLMDCQMPEMDGLAATQEIRKFVDPDHQIPIVALTANTLPEDKERCLEAGMDSFLEKPLSRKNLQAILQQWAPNFAKEIDEELMPIDTHSSQEEPGNSSLPMPQLTQEPTLDSSILQELRVLGGADDPDFLIEIIDQFLFDLPRHLDAIQQALEQEDTEALIKAAHTCKGSCRSIGASLLAEVSYRLETMGREGNTKIARETWKEWLEEKERTTEAFKQQRQGLSL